MKKNRIFIIIATVFSTFSFTGCGSKNGQADAYGNFETREIIVSSKANGELVNFNIDEGQTVAEAQFIGHTDTSLAHLNLKQTQSRLQAIDAKTATIESNRQTLEVEKQNLLENMDKIKVLVENNAAPKDNLDKLEQQLRVLKSKINAVEVQKNELYKEISAMQATVQQAQNQLEDCYIVNPMEGVVLQKIADEHEFVSMGKPLYKLGQLQTMELKAYVSGDQLHKIKQGDTVSVFYDVSDDAMKEIPGIVQWIASEAEFTPKIIQTKEERVNLVYAVKVKVPNPEGEIKSGMPGELRF